VGNAEVLTAASPLTQFYKSQRQGNFHCFTELWSVWFYVEKTWKVYFSPHFQHPLDQAASFTMETNKKLIFALVLPLLTTGHVQNKRNNNPKLPFLCRSQVYQLTTKTYFVSPTCIVSLEQD
jgi:hypothetical protein